MNNQKLIDVFLESVGIFENVFGKNTDKIILDREREKAKNILKNVYGYKDVDLFFPAEIDEQKFIKTLETMYRFSGNNNNNIDLQNQNNTVTR